MTNKTARKIVTEWRPDQHDSGRDNELLVKRLAHHLPEPDVWAAEPSARRVLTLTGRSLFVIQQEHELFFGRLIVTKDDQDTTVSFTDGPVGEQGAWPREWRFDFRHKPRHFPELKLTTEVAMDEPTELEAFARKVAELTGWDVPGKAANGEGERP